MTKVRVEGGPEDTEGTGDRGYLGCGEGKREGQKGTIATETEGQGRRVYNPNYGTPVNFLVSDK
jgi:hypothetical protein